MEFVLFESFNDYMEANIVKGMPEANDILCWLQDENSGTIRRIYSNGIQKALDLINASKKNSII